MMGMLSIMVVMYDDVWCMMMRMVLSMVMGMGMYDL